MQDSGMPMSQMRSALGEDGGGFSESMLQERRAASPRATDLTLPTQCCGGQILTYLHQRIALYNIV